MAEEKTKCGAHLPNKPPEETCKLPAGFRTNHQGVGRCFRHSGATPNAQKYANKVIARQEAERLGLPIEIDPQTALMQGLYESYGHASWLRQKVEEEDRVYESVTTKGEGWSKTTKEVSVYKKLWDEERERCAKLATACIKAGIAERQVAIAEQQADIFVQVIKNILDSPELELTEAQRAAADRIVPLQLRAAS